MITSPRYYTLFLGIGQMPILIVKFTLGLRSLSLKNRDSDERLLERSAGGERFKREHLGGKPDGRA